MTVPVQIEDPLSYIRGMIRTVAYLVHAEG